MIDPVLTRRQILKAQAAAVAATAAGIPISAGAQNLVTDRTATDLTWSKAPCRFCGTGCSVMVATKDDKVVATHGDVKSEVNRGLNCVKGYFLSKIMYGSDRLTQPLLRMRDGKYAKDGEFTPVSWDAAFDIMAEKFKQTLKEKGPTAVGMFGSGQWTVWEGYAAAKLFKAGFRSNNIDPNARHCMASAVAGFMRTFGMDEPMGCYDDFENADAFVLWGSNMAEMHPILWTRLTDRRLSHPHVQVCVLSTFEHRCFDLADIPAIFTPHSDLVLLNFIANHIIETGRVNRDFVDKHTIFRRGNPDIGYGLRPEHPLEQAAANNDAVGGSTEMTFDEYAEFVGEYTLDKAHEMSGVPKETLLKIAELYADPSIKVMSLWTMGVNQHTRGVWVNNMLYNVHLLTGKIAEPGNSPFSLTGQPSACGTAREVGTFSHRLPADMVVTNKEHRAYQGGAHLAAAGGHDPGPKPGYHAVLQSRMLKDGLLNAYWVQVNNNHPGRPPTCQRGGPIPASATPTISSSFPTPIPPSPRSGRRSDPADRDVGREGRRLWQCRAAHAVLAPAGVGAGRGALGSLAADGVLEALHRSRRSGPSRADREEAGCPPARRCSTCSTSNGQVDKFPLDRDLEAGYANRRVQGDFGFYVHKGLFEEYASVRPRIMATTSRRSRPITRSAACAGRSSTAQETRWRFREEFGPLRQGRHRRAVLRASPTARRASSPCPTSRRRRSPGQGLSVLAVHGTRGRALAFRHDDPPRARALQARSPKRALLHASGRRAGSSA